MRQPTAVLRIRPEDLGSAVSCTGSQLDSILSAVAPVVGDLIWYYADVETNDGSPEWLAERSPLPMRIGGLDELREKARSTDQFLSGVFLGVLASIDLSNAEWWTEDDTCRSLQGACVEIRAFDTSYFEVYALSGNVLNSVMNTVGGKLLGESVGSHES